MAGQERTPLALEADKMDWADSACPEEEELAPLRPPKALPNQHSNLNRRRSISMPLLNVPPTKVRIGRGLDDDSSDSYDDGVSDDDREESVTIRVPLRNSRKKSLAPPMIKINDGDYLNSRDYSPANSTASINSLSSLLKEKLVMTFPGVLLRKKPREYKLKGFVALLFLTIVFLVGFAYVFYHQQVLQRAYFEKIRLNNKQRIVRVFNEEGLEILYGYLGTSLNNDKVYQCLNEDVFNDGSVCMEWMHKARLYLRYEVLNGLRCYNLVWLSLADNVFPTDCFDLSQGKGHWYGGGHTYNMTWPLENGVVDLSPFITGDSQLHSWGNVLERFFLNLKGVSLSIDENTPLYVSINNDKKRLCLQARYDDFAYFYHRERYPKLNYSICVAEDVKSLQSYFTDRVPWNSKSKSKVEIVNTLLTEPVWRIAPMNKEQLTESMVVNYTDDVLSLGFLRQGHVILNEFWQPNVGDFTVDTDRFPTMKETVDTFRRRGFQLVLSIQPFISTESVNFPMAVKNKLLVTERGTGNVPALTKYKTLLSAGILDITNNYSVPWLQEKLHDLKDQFGLNAFYLDFGTAYDLPHYYLFKNKFTGPDQFKTLFQESISNKVNVIGVSSAIQRPPVPIFVSLPQLPSAWESIKVIIPTVLTYSVIGYPFVMPGPIGGEMIIDETSETILPEKELYIRWLELSTFLPVIQYMHLPSSYDAKVLEIAKFYTALRQRLINPLLKTYAKEALEKGLPIIRPLWMLDPNDVHCQMVVDQFAIGEELIVAPIVSRGATERKVYLPKGVWKDGIDGSIRKGQRWIDNYRIAEDKIAYFVQIPDDTRL